METSEIIIRIQSKLGKNKLQYTEFKLTVPWRVLWDWDTPVVPVYDIACDRSADSRGTRSPVCPVVWVWTSCRWSTAGHCCISKMIYKVSAVNF